jgi:hypothetical protein
MQIEELTFVRSIGIIIIVTTQTSIPAIHNIITLKGRMDTFENASKIV